MSEINKLIQDKIDKYPEDIQKILIKALELAESNQPTAISEHLEGYLRDIVSED